MKNALAALVLLSCVSKLFASPTSDLGSPSPETRAAAAKILRATYAPPPQTNWDWLLAKLKVGDKMTNVEAILRSHGIKPGFGDGEQILRVEYRLDDTWSLSCYYNYQAQYRHNETLYSRDLFFSPNWVPVAYPSNFTGIWDEYYVNGQKCMETTLKGGVRWGDQTCYKFDGQKVYTTLWDSNKMEGTAFSRDYAH